MNSFQMAEVDEATALAAFARRDAAFDGRFVVAVTSTRIYCRPSCPARRPRPENVLLMADSAAAQAAGFRPCKRCAPDSLSGDERVVAAMIRAIKAARGPVPLARLARAVGCSEGVARRAFRSATGLTPAAYGRALRLERARAALGAEGSVTDAIQSAGYEAASRFYDEAKGRLGMAPSVWIRGGEGVTIRWTVAATSLGSILVAATDKGVCRVAFAEDRADLAWRFPKARLEAGGADFARLVEQVVGAIEAPARRQEVPLDVRGTAFQERVWDALQSIPPGETRTYADLAAEAGHPGAFRAAGSANGANPVAVLIPCHRVVRADGSIGGYAYGEAIKKELLRRERS